MQELFNTIHSFPGVIPVLNRLGIRLGVGDSTLEQAMQQADIPEKNFPFVNALLEMYTSATCSDAQATAKLQNISWNQFIEGYFEKTAVHYKTVQLPNIEKHLNAFIGMSMSTNTGKGQLAQLGQLLAQFSEEMRNNFGFENLNSVIACEDLLLEMQLIMIKYLYGNFNDNLCYATIFALRSLEADTRKHRCIIEHIHPNNIACQQNLTSFGQENTLNGVSGVKEEEKTLSAREKEVLILVTQGKLNKEIAQELNISFQTVLSHRKNISSKLGIKTVAGLIFYAIRANLVKI